MASYHCAVKTGGKGRAGPHAEYISREGKYAPENTRGKSRMEDLEFTTSGNMPAWAAHDASIFWLAADEYERANGATYREIEVALPRELNPEQRRALVEDFIQQQIGDRHPFTYAIHIPQAAIAGGEQPHAHIMYSERTLDGIARDPDLFFKRANSKNPECGGCKKDSAGTKERLLETRERWATIQNRHLEMHGHPDRVDHRSLKERGIDRQPERHLGPLAVKQMQRFDVSALLARRAAEGELERSLAELKTIDISADLRTALADRDNKLAQEKDDDRIRAAALTALTKSSRAIGSAIGGTTANVSNAGALVRTAGGDLGSATEGAERRILRSHTEHCAPAIRQSRAIASDLIQQIADKFRAVVRAITSAQIAIAGRAVAARQAPTEPTLEAIAAQTRVAPVSLLAKPQQLAPALAPQRVVFDDSPAFETYADIMVAETRKRRAEAEANAPAPKPAPAPQREVHMTTLERLDQYNAKKKARHAAEVEVERAAETIARAKAAAAVAAEAARKAPAKESALPGTPAKAAPARPRPPTRGGVGR